MFQSSLLLNLPDGSPGAVRNGDHFATFIENWGGAGRGGAGWGGAHFCTSNAVICVSSIVLGMN